MAGAKREQQAAIFKADEDPSSGKKSLGRGKSEESCRISVVKYVLDCPLVFLLFSRRLLKTSTNMS